jgi:hypothetical protein
MEETTSRQETTMPHDDGVSPALPPSAQLLHMANPVLPRIVQLTAGLGLAEVVPGSVEVRW